MKIYLVCHYFPPEIGAPQARLSEMASNWKKLGHEVTVLTGFPNHPTGIIAPEFKGKIFQTEIVDGIRIWRHWLYATPNKGFLKKIFGHLSFMFSCFFLSMFRGERPDIYVVSSPTFFSVISVWLMSAIRRVPFIFEVRDLWPGIFVELGILKNKALISVLEAMELFLYRRAKKVVVVTEGFKENLIQRKIEKEKIEVITNGVNLSFFAENKIFESLDGLPFDENKFKILYIGAHGISHGLDTIIETAKEMENEQVQFIFVGEGAVKDHLMEKAQSLKLKNVIFLPGTKRDNVPSFYRMADVCLVPLKDIKGFETFIPSKMFEIMASKRPIIGSVTGESARILERSGGALVISPENKVELCQAILKLQNDSDLRCRLGESGYQFVKEHFNRDTLSERYLRLLESSIN